MIQTIENVYKTFCRQLEQMEDGWRLYAQFRSLLCDTKPEYLVSNDLIIVPDMDTIETRPSTAESTDKQIARGTPSLITKDKDSQTIQQHLSADLNSLSFDQVYCVLQWIGELRHRDIAIAGLHNSLFSRYEAFNSEIALGSGGKLVVRKDVKRGELLAMWNPTLVYEGFLFNDVIFSRQRIVERMEKILKYRYNIQELTVSFDKIDEQDCRCGNIPKVRRRQILVFCQPALWLDYNGSANITHHFINGQIYIAATKDLKRGSLLKRSSNRHSIQNPKSYSRSFLYEL